AMWSSVSTTITNAFAAMGKIKINLKLMLMWTALTWILTPLLMSKYGYNGVALASALVASSSIIPMIILKRMLSVKLFSNVWPQLLSALLMGIFLKWLLSLLVIGHWILVIPLIAAGAILYFAFIFILTGKKLINELRSVKQLVI
ncbi:MAG TPA: hypothetical protein DCE80_04020, partial [Ignavibacteriales bacterium]|nr:hypothetical protein [Ignavibacteriales bacterium]